MYPFIRMIHQNARAARLPALDFLGTHVSHHRCWPWDLDMWFELNNGRTLTIFDLGRIPLAVRTGLVGTMRRERWSITIAGSSVRYRRRVRMFQRLTMRSRVIGWDDKFIYLEQAMFRDDGECTSHALFRGAVTDAGGLVRPPRLLAALGAADRMPPRLPDWVTAWISAEDTRPWPPMRDSREDARDTAA